MTHFLSDFHWSSNMTTQAIGILAALVAFLGLTSKSDKRLMSLSIASCALWAVHFSLLGSWPATASNLLAGLRNGFSLRFRGVVPALIFATAVAVAGVLTIHSPFGILPILGTIIVSLAAFLTRGATLRGAYMLSSLLWLMHDVHMQSIGGICGDLTSLTAGTIALVRLLLSGASANEEAFTESAVAK
jgi:hypothetical protein